ncbi:UL16-binding protein 1-like isoform X1 [Leptonychotes weddellii]|uniref:UL16-binding protein 1-like isoform X1 n=1 Tax=Leptonychotes weddellii TaxID=9713 RepID=A0A7F8QZP1_LEPWE|nr:UL16-binding protein 1-like isoform X1 [Leptonychotes weddellii]XP_030886580.1 UL16-binding protein 1-like isoform X1 [Leptonychotes weddellii]
MQPPAATRFTLGLAVLLLLVPWVTAAAAGSVVGAASSGRETHALSLSYNFNITSRARPGQPWCEIQGLVNGNQFLSYDCRSKEVKPVGPLGMKLKDTAFWERQKETLEDLVEELRRKLLDIKTGIFTKSHPLTLQGRLVYECGPDRHPRGSWQFAFNEQITHRFDPETGNWTMVPPEDQRFQGTLDSDGELTGFLMRISNGDCKGWLQQVLEHWDEMLETTGAPATTPGVVRVKGTAIRLITSILPVLLTCSILPGIQGRLL